MYATLDVSFFSYLDRPIFEITLNGLELGAAPAHGFYGANGMRVDERIQLGPQIVSWRLGGPRGMARNGETVRAKNAPLLDKVPPNTKWLALHIYDDDTVEIALSKRDTDELETERGKKIIAEWEKKHGR